MTDLKTHRTVSHLALKPFALHKGKFCNSYIKKEEKINDLRTRQEASILRNSCAVKKMVIKYTNLELTRFSRSSVTSI